MQRVLDHIERAAAEVSRHPFITQLNSVTADGAYTVLSNFALSFVHLSLTFRDINELYFSYDQPRNELERIVDSHARADAEHWKFLFEDLEALCVNQPRTATQYIERFWRPEDLYIRKYIYSVLARARACGDSVIKRMVAMEAAEAGVRKFFGAVRRNAALIRESRNIELVYFGDHHIDTEIATALDKSPFAEIPLDEGALKEAIATVDEHFAANREFLDQKFLVSKELLREVT